MDWDKIHADWKAGMQPPELEKKYGVKQDTVRKRINRYWKQDAGQDKKRDRTEKQPKPRAKTGVGGNGNLIPYSMRSEDEAREDGRKGGVKSGEVRREKSAAKAVALMVLNGDIPTSSTKTSAMRTMLQEMGILATELNMQAAMIGGQVLSGMRGNHLAAQLVLSLVGEDPTMNLKTREVDLREKDQESDSDNALLDDWLEGIADE